MLVCLFLSIISCKTIKGTKFGTFFSSGMLSAHPKEVEKQVKKAEEQKLLTAHPHI
jgi:hypothetical protein